MTLRDAPADSAINSAANEAALKVDGLVILQ